jgi:hypothetical protein
MKTSTTATLIALLTLITLTACFSTTYAITGNSQPDSTPYVCLVVLFSDAARTQPVSYSSGILISSTVVLTAGHSIVGGVAASVCFDQGPMYYSIDESGKVTYTTNQPIYNGVPIPYPEYNPAAKPSKVLKTSDVGLIILDKPVAEVTSFPALPPAGLADNLPKKTNLQIIGYGVHDPNSAPQLSGSISRNSATVNLLGDRFQGSDKYIKCSANAAHGKGGISLGDSGGPVMYTFNGQRTVLAVNAYVNNDNCAAASYHTRIDNPNVLNWIIGYI